MSEGTFSEFSIKFQILKDFGLTGSTRHYHIYNKFILKECEIKRDQMSIW